MAGSIQAYRGLGAAPGAEIQVALLDVGGNRSAVGTVVAGSPSVRIIDAVLKDQRLVDCLVVLLLRQISLIKHLIEDIHLAVFVSAGTVTNLPFIQIFTGGIGIKQGRVIGDADQTGTFRDGKALQLLAEIGSSGGLDTIAALAQIDPVQVLLHDDILIVLLFQHLRTENLHDLTLHGDTLFICGIFDQLLGNGGAAELGITAKEHIGAGLHGCDPVHTLVLIEALVLNGNGGIDQRLGNLIPGGRLTVRGGINLLKQLNIAFVVHIMDIGGLFDVVVLVGPVGRLRQNVILKIFRQRSHEDNGADDTDQRNGCSRTNSNLCSRPKC